MINVNVLWFLILWIEQYTSSIIDVFILDANKTEYLIYLLDYFGVSLLNTKKLTLIALMASAYAALSLLPGIPMIGADGSTIDLVRMLEIGYGLILGPVYGPAAAFIGAFIGKSLQGGGFGIFFTPLAAISSLVAALLGRKKGRYWWISAGILGVLIAGWYLFDVGRTIWYFPVMHLFALLLLVFSRSKISNWISSKNKRTMSIGMFICSFISTVAGHMLGNLIFILMLSPEPGLFVTILAVSLIERLGIAIGATFFGVSLLVAVRELYPELLD